MKKVSRNIFFLSIVFIFFLGLAPYFFVFDKVKQTISEEISSSLDSSVTIEKMHWVWLPLPHLTLINTNITDDHYELFVPKAKIYPSWRLVIGETRQPGKITLDRPQFYINETAYLPRKPAERSLPEIPIIFTDGQLKVEPSEKFKNIFRSDTLFFKDINGRLKLMGEEAEVDLKAASPFSRAISLQGSINITEKVYQFSLDSQEIKLHKTVKTFLQGRLTPVESTARLTGKVIGKGLQHIEGDLHGTLPCFVVKPQNRQVLLTCGYADLKLLKYGELLRLDINDLEIKDPQVNLSGHIERNFLKSTGGEHSPDAEPVWTIDLTGSDLDVTAIRQKVLTLWHDNTVAKTVTDIVLGGKALSAAFLFSGRTADFENMDSMIIEADALNADIHVPGANLDLTQASGPILIKDSILTGHDLSARLGNSFGRNAELFLDLKELGKKFTLEIDIEADLADLPPVLAQLVEHDGFQHELGKFSEVSGKATGNLRLGETLDDIITQVDVKDAQLTARYEPIPEQISIDSGALHVGPQVVSWHKVKGFIGQQEITRSSGNVSWQTGEPLLQIDDVQALLQATSFLDLLRKTGAIPSKINEILSAVNGAIEITGGTMHGPVLQPESWEYDIAMKASGLSLQSPMLPEPLIAKTITAELNHAKASIHEAKILFLDQDFILDGEFRHHLLAGWQGMITYNGSMQTKLANWISSKGWFPEKLRPQIPCTMEDLQVNWQDEALSVSGTILQGVNGGRLPLAKIDYVDTPERLHIKELTFYAAGEQGRLELDFWRLSPHSLFLSWTGYVNANTIDALFRHSSFSSGTFSGDFNVTYLADQPEATRFEGILSAENLFLKSGDSAEPIVIKGVSMTGIGRQLRIPVIDLAIGSERITGLGQLAAEKEGLQLDISLASSFLSKKSLANLSEAIQGTYDLFLNKHSEKGAGINLAKGWDITGRIGFDFDSFRLSRKNFTPYEEAQPITYTFYDVHGDLQLAPDKISRTEIFSASLCGLDFEGTWFSDTVLGQKFHLKTPADNTLYLENVLPCLGIQQDIIEGEFSLRANLMKESNLWYGGNIHVRSSHGRILRLKTLSRIFKVINITDLFEEQIGYTGNRGFPFNQMDIDTHIEANNLIFDRAIILGEGLNLFAKGEVHLDDYDADLTLLIAPFKTFDSMISKVPIIGQPVMGQYGSRVSIPVAIKGPVADPVITPLHPEAIGNAVLGLVKDTLMLPYNILNPPEKSDDQHQNKQTDN